MGFSDPTTPNQADYTTFLYGVVGIPTANLPSSADIIATSLSIALSIVNETLNCADANIYTLAVYNLAADRLINFASDVSGQTYFQDLRSDLKIGQVRVGVPSSANDQGTAVGILNPEFMKTKTLRDLQTLKTIYGRTYMEFALDYGSNLWGLS